MDRLEALAAFAAVAELGGFANAARALRVSPTAVTRAIAALERRLGVQLLQRTTRSVRLTEQGALFLPRCRQILADLKNAEDLMMGARSDPQGTLVITAPVVFGRTHIVPIVAKLLAQYPSLSVQLVLLDRIVQLVEEGVDVAIRIGDLADSALHAVRLGKVRRVLAASPAYLEAHGTPASVPDLKRHSIVAVTGLSPSDEWRFGPAGRASILVRPRLILNSVDAGIAAVTQGLGIGRFLSYQVDQEVRAGSLRLVLETAAPDPVPVHIVFQGARSNSPNIRAFVETTGAHIRRSPF